MNRKALAIVAAMLSAATLSFVMPASAQQIGTTGAVNPDALSAPPGGSLKTMNVGSNVVYKEKINTSANGSVQLLFVDRTTLNVGPNSQLVIDEFVYDPKTDTGRIAATLTKGVMRFVGGQTSHTGGATIRTPATTLGVRGGVVTVRHDAQNGTRAINHFGVVTAQTASGTEIIRRPGFALNVPTPQAPPTAPTRVLRAEIDLNNRQLTSAPQQTGGRTMVPTDQGMAKVGAGQTNVNVSPTLVQGQQQNVAQAAQKTTAAPPVQITTIVEQVTQDIAQTGSQQTTTQTLTPTVVAPVAAALPQPRYYALDNVTVASAMRPLQNAVANIVQNLPRGNVIPDNFEVNGGNYTDKTFVAYGRGGVDGSGAPNVASRGFVGTIAIAGSGATQTSTMIGIWASIYPTTQGEMVLDGGVRGTTRLNAFAHSGQLAASFASTPGSVVMDSNYSLVSATVDQNSFDENGNRLTRVGSYNTGLSPTSGSDYTYSLDVARGPAPVGLGSSRPNVQLHGVGTGLMRTWSGGTTNTFAGPSFPIWGDLYINLSEAMTFNASLNVGRIGMPSTNLADNFSNGTLLFGYQGDGTGARSAYVDYNNFLAGESAMRDGTRLSTINGGTVINQSAMMMNVERQDAMALFPGVSFCACDYSRWGFWSTNTRRLGVSSSGGSDDQVYESLHMGTWAAGVPSRAVDIPTTGVATYTGHIIGSFKNGGAEYIAAGNFQNAVNFGANSGAVTVTNLDGRNYAGNVTFDPSYRNLFSGSYLPTTSGPSAGMSVNGAFMQSPNSPVGEMLGMFQVGGAGYVGAGTFVAKK